MNILKKRMTLRAFVFPKLLTPNTSLDKCLKNPVWEDSSTRNMVNVPKHCWNLHHSTFILFINHWQVNWVRKSLSFLDAEPWACLLRHRLLMKSILLLIETIYKYQFRFNYLRKNKLFLNFPCFFKFYIKFWIFWKKRWPSELLYFRYYGLRKCG